MDDAFDEHAHFECVDHFEDEIGYAGDDIVVGEAGEGKEVGPRFGDVDGGPAAFGIVVVCIDMSGSDFVEQAL